MTRGESNTPPSPDMTSLVVRRGVPSDAPALAELAARTFIDTFAADNRPDDIRAHVESSFGIARQSAELANPDVVTILALREEAPIAYAQVRRNAPPACVTEPGSVELHRFYVDRSAHGSGIARTLMSAVFAAASELGGRHVWLGVWERNLRAIAFYARMGFVPVGSHAFYVGPDRQTDRVFVAPVGVPDRRTL